ncbi:MAG: hypothetical protein ACE15F_25255 [bacterium]
MNLNNPAEGVPFGIEAKFDLPDSSYQVESIQLKTAEENIIRIEIAVLKKDIIDPDPMPSVAHFVLAVEGLKTGFYTVLVVINGEISYKEGFYVGNVVLPTPTPTPPPLVFEPLVEIIPAEPDVKDTVVARVTGFLPDASYAITETSVEFRMEMIWLQMQVETSGAGDQVKIPFTREFTLGQLPVNGYAAMLVVNGIEAVYTKFVVQDKDNPPVVKPYFNIMNTRIQVIPDNPKPDEEFTMYLEGEFPTSGYAFLEKKVEAMEGRISVDVSLQEPSGPVDEVITAFSEVIGTLRLPEGVYKIEARINGAFLEPYRLAVGETNSTGIPSDLLAYRLADSSSGALEWLVLDESNNYERYNQAITTGQIEKGAVPDSDWSRLLDSLNRANFAELDAEYKPVQPVENGLIYEISFNNKTVKVHQGANIPPALGETLDILNTIMNRPAQSSTPGWNLYY